MSEAPKIPVPSIVRERLRVASPGGGSHPDANALSAFAENTLSARERSQVMDHLAACADCRDVVALALPETEEATLPAQAKPASGFRLRWTAARWSALAATAAVLVAVVIIYRVQPAPENYASTVAESKQATAPQPANGVAAGNTSASTKAVPALEKQRKDVQNEKELSSSNMVIASKMRSFDREAAVAGKSSEDKVKTADMEGSRDQKLAFTASSGTPRRIVSREQQVGVLSGTPAQNAPAEPANPQSSTNAAAVANAFAISPRDSLKPSSLAASNANLSATDHAAAPSIAGLQPTRNTRAALARPAPAPPATADTFYGNAFAKKAETPPATTSESVEVTGQAAAVPMQNANVAQFQKLDSLRAPTLPNPVPIKWRVRQGHVQQSLDNGANWSNVLVAKAVAFNAVSAAGDLIWAGGSNAVLYHSIDNGQTWSPLWSYARDASAKAEYRYPKAPASITEIIFSDQRYGQMRVKVRGKEPQEFFFTTSDGGQSWLEETID